MEIDPCPTPCNDIRVQGLERMVSSEPTKFSCSLLHSDRGAGDSPTDTGCVLLHHVSDARCPNHLSVYH